MIGNVYILYPNRIEIHPLYVGKLTISGKDGTDAKRYQENVVQQAIEEVEGKTENDET